jgi:hypothetical protein
MQQDEQAQKPEQPPVEREPHIPRPPTREELEQIGREQALITDEWSGETRPSHGGGQPHHSG